jgi:4-hydroxy-3-polyprenylbenzoate decarboxylase
MRLIVGVTGASGSIIAIRLLEALRDHGVEREVVLTEWAAKTIRIETDHSLEDVRALATVHHRVDNLAASISSGSYPVDGMIVCPCSMNTLAAMAHGFSDNLLTRAADVTLKERRPLVVVPRETPLSSTHLRNMLELSAAGAQVVPPMPAFYNRPQTMEDMVQHLVARLLDQFGIDNDRTRRWGPSSMGPDGVRQVRRSRT